MLHYTIDYNVLIQINNYQLPKIFCKSIFRIFVFEAHLYISVIKIKHLEGLMFLKLFLIRAPQKLFFGPFLLKNVKNIHIILVYLTRQALLVPGLTI